VHKSKGAPHGLSYKVVVVVEVVTALLLELELLLTELLLTILLLELELLLVLLTRLLLLLVLLELLLLLLGTTHSGRPIGMATAWKNPISEDMGIAISVNVFPESPKKVTIGVHTESLIKCFPSIR
jgi:hypothetical protein